ncbi:hypothetical protein TRFO_38905 [Tritrichomonas foetus]|uniref:Myb-like domain-containing protein n=1 Tax=Tritrichomonas foetus TaxID=1144522 RepID=A0A1J4J6S1_9EUKA|nr:hypothetical protein TRFO_38905 [Tritrichomonas foetus]|eukprot:OHS94930.1 hypothetical protein TRFO_38905 [Tritrichomonas foetus]
MLFIFRNFFTMKRVGEDEIFDQCSCSPLLLSDVIQMIQQLPPETDPETAETLKNFRQTVFQRRVAQVNEYIYDFLEVWPKGQPVDFFIALEMSRDDIHQAIQNLKNPNFLRKVSAESSARGYVHSSSSRRRKTEIRFEFDASDGDDDEDEDNWTEKDIKKLKDLINEYGTKFDVIAKKMRKSAKMCKMKYDKLKKQKIIIPKKKLNIASVTIIRDNIRYTAGQTVQKFNEMELMNPIPGCVDQLTMKPMSMPALSPDGYVLDYETWMKVLNEKKMNPFTRNRIKSKRELVILTIDNYDNYKDKIVNFEEIQPC